MYPKLTFYECCWVTLCSRFLCHFEAEHSAPGLVCQGHESGNFCTSKRHQEHSKYSQGESIAICQEYVELDFSEGGSRELCWAANTASCLQFHGARPESDLRQSLLYTSYSDVQ